MFQLTENQLTILLEEYAFGTLGPVKIKLENRIQDMKITVGEYELGLKDGLSESVEIIDEMMSIIEMELEKLKELENE